MKHVTRNFLLISWALVSVPAVVHAVDPVITTQPVDQVVSSDKDVTFSVTALGTSPMQYQWYYRTYTVTGGGDWIKGSGTSASYTVHAANYLGQRPYQFCCVISNTKGSKTSRFANLTVYQGFFISTQPQDQRTTVGHTATFSLVSTPAASTYNWYVNGKKTATTVPSYTTPATTLADNLSNVMVVLLKGTSFGQSSPVALVVDSNPAAGVPVITTEPADQNVAAGTTVKFSVVASGDSPLTYQWCTRLAGGGAGIISGATSATYSFPAVQTTTVSQYCCVVSNAKGKKTSRFATPTIYNGYYFTKVLTGQRVKVGQTATFTLAVSPPTATLYQWSIFGKLYNTSSPTFTTRVVTLADNLAPVSCFVSNGDSSKGYASSPAVTLVVEADSPDPIITKQPSNKTVTVGQTATFSVTASGTAPLSYQWQKNGTNITSATSASYTTPVTKSGDNGTVFTVIVSNPLGSVTSQGATLTVTGTAAAIMQQPNDQTVPSQNTTLTVTGTAPAITKQPISQTVTVGQSGTFSVTASGTLALNYQWQKNRLNIPAATSASYTTPPTTASDNGSVFSVLVTDLGSVVTSEDATLSVTVPALKSEPAAAATSTSADLTYINKKEGKTAYFQGVDITVTIYSRSGALVKTLRGTNIRFDGADLQPGVYHYSKNGFPPQNMVVVS